VVSARLRGAQPILQAFHEFANAGAPNVAKQLRAHAKFAHAPNSTVAAAPAVYLPDTL
jgi:hypothetical protein